MSTAEARNRLWLQVTPAREPAATRLEAAPVVAAIAVDLAVSAVGTVVKVVSDRLVATDQYVLRTLQAYEPAFAIRANAASSEFLPRYITLNVGPRPVPIPKVGSNATFPAPEVERGVEYRSSPVVVRLELTGSKDGTALRARLAHWKYADFIAPPTAPFKRRKRKVAIEVKMSDVDGGALLKLALQMEATRAELPTAGLASAEHLPWVKRPVKSVPGDRASAEEQWFGPVNVEASVTEVAEPGWLAKLLAGTLGNQKAAIEKLVKDRVGQALDETEAAKARIEAVKEALAARGVRGGLRRGSGGREGLPGRRGSRPGSSAPNPPRQAHLAAAARGPGTGGVRPGRSGLRPHAGPRVHGLIRSSPS